MENREKPKESEKGAVEGLRGNDLAELAASSGSPYYMLDQSFSPEDVVVEGKVSVSRLRSGLVIHAAETAEINNMTMEMVLQPCLNVFLILEGGIEFHLDDELFTFSALKDDGLTQPTAYAVSIAKPAKLARRSRRGVRTRKVNIMIQPAWLKDCGFEDKDEAKDVGCFLRRHLAQTSWRPSSRTVALAEQIINPPSLPPLVKELYLESRAIELAAEALQALSGDLQCPALKGVTTSDFSRAHAVRNFLEEHMSENLTLATIASESGMGVSTIQRLFKSTYGKTVAEYVRVRKLERARNAIETQGLSVSEAAYLAGYNNPANFATAFKRAFGISPRQLRK